MIVHADVDAFYASVAQRDDPALRGKPLAVAGSSRRAVVLTASYEARPYGIRSAMPLYKARALCTDLIVVAPDFERYRDSSRRIFEILGAGALAIEGLSLDEAFVDLGAVAYEDALGFARNARARVRAEVGLTVSAGVATQKMVAKIASDEAKPDGLRGVEPGCEAAYLAPLPVSRLWGVGPKTYARLAGAGIATIGDLAQLSDGALAQLLGSGGSGLRELARGNDRRRVETDRETRSVSSERTFEYDVESAAELRAYLREVAIEVADRLRAHGLRGSTIGVKLKRADFRIVQRQLSTREPVDDAETIYGASLSCLERAEVDGIPIRLLGVRVAALVAAGPRQPSLFA
jgi:DNA polymerase-4